MSVTLSSLPGKFKWSYLNDFFCPDGIIPDAGLTGPNNTYIYKYIIACYKYIDKVNSTNKIIFLITDI